MQLIAKVCWLSMLFIFIAECFSDNGSLRFVLIGWTVGCLAGFEMHAVLDEGCGGHFFLLLASWLDVWLTI